MKRSELIKNIEKDSDYKYNSNQINEILFLMEAYGMLPPKVINKDPGHFPGDAFTYETNEWEPEE